MNNDYQYEEALLVLNCYRRHVFNDKQYTLFVFHNVVTLLSMSYEQDSNSCHKDKSTVCTG